MNKELDTIKIALLSAGRLLHEAMELLADAAEVKWARDGNGFRRPPAEYIWRDKAQMLLTAGECSDGLPEALAALESLAGCLEALR